MTKMDIVDYISEQIAIPKKNIDRVLMLLFENIKTNISQGETIYFRGFGTFGTKLRKARVARNPKTNEKINVPAHKVPYFKPGKELKEMVTKKKID